MADEKIIADRPAQQDQSGSPDPTAGLLYAPDRSGKGRRPRWRRPLRPAVAYRKPAKSDPAQGTKAEPEVEKMTLQQAFTLDVNDYPGNDERAVRAASFLLDWASEEGNEPVDGFLAQGLRRVLDLAANNMARARQRNRNPSEG